MASGEFIRPEIMTQVSTVVDEGSSELLVVCFKLWAAANVRRISSDFVLLMSCSVVGLRIVGQGKQRKGC